MQPGVLPFATQPFATSTAFGGTGFTPNTLAFRLRVFNPESTAIEFTFSSLASDGMPYIAEVPSGDGQEVDLMTGAIRTGAYQVTVIDVPTGSDGTGTLRALTSRLVDGGGRQHLLSRRALLEVSTNGGTSWSYVWMAGYITNVRQSDAITYSITISDTRRIEQNHRAFTWGVNPQDFAKSERLLFPQRGCLLGGPIISNPTAAKPGWGPTPDSGGIETELAASESAIWAEGGNRIVALKWLAASDIAPNYTQTRDFGEYADYANKVLAPYGVAATPGFYTAPEFAPLTQGNVGLANFWFPDLRVYMTDGTTTWVGVLRAFFPWTFGGVNGSWIGGIGTTGRFPYIYATLDAGQPALPSVGTNLRVRVVHSVVSESSPLYLDDHPVDIVCNLYDSVNIPFDVASAVSIRNRIGTDVRLACRITEPQTMGPFLASAIFGPFGFSARTEARVIGGVLTPTQVFFSTRVGDSVPIYTIGTNDIAGDAVPSGFDVDETTVVTALEYKYRVLAKAITDPSSNQPPPPDGIVQTEHVLELPSGDTSTYSTRVVQYDIPGMVRHLASWQPDMSALVTGTARELFDRFGRGAPTYALPVLGTSAAALAQVGDEVLITASYVPNQNYRIGESTIGPRVAQIVRRDETPIGPIFKLVDSGPNTQLATAPTITVTKESLNPRTLASFTITNAATLNASNVAVEVEYTTGAATPSTNGTPYTRYAVASIATGPVLLPAFVPGERVWVRARSVAPERRPSAWSAWANVALDAWVAPSLVMIGTTSSTAVKVSWNNGNPYDRVAVYLYAGPTNPADWEPYRIATLQPGSTQTTLRGFVASTAYRVAVAHEDSGTGAVSNYAVNNFTSGSTTSLTAPRVSYMGVIPTVEDAQYQSGIALGLWAGDESLEIEIQRAPNVAGSPGTWTTIAIVPGATTVFGDPLPATGATYWYRSRHVNGGFTAGAYQNNLGPYLASAWPYPIVSGVVGSLPPKIARPSRITPTLQVNVAPGSPNFTVKWSAGTIGQVEIWQSGAPLSPQPTSPWSIPNPGVGSSTTYTYYVYADGQLLTRDIVLQGFDPDEVLPPGGTTGQVLSKVSGTSYDVAWTTPSSAGDVVGPASSVDEAIARFDGTTGKLLQSSATMTLTDAGAMDLGTNGSVKTGAPGASTAGVWRFGVFNATTVSLDTTGYITVEIGGVTYNLALAI